MCNFVHREVIFIMRSGTKKILRIDLREVNKDHHKDTSSSKSRDSYEARICE